MFGKSKKRLAEAKAKAAKEEAEKWVPERPVPDDEEVRVIVWSNSACPPATVYLPYGKAKEFARKMITEPRKMAEFTYPRGLCPKMFFNSKQIVAIMIETNK